MTYNYNEWLKNPIKLFCKCGCNKEIIIQKCYISRYKFSGIPEYITGHNPPWNKGIPQTQEVKDKISKKLIGCKLPEETKQKIKESAQRGEKHHNWKEKIKKVCLICGKNFEVIPSQKNIKCCSFKCAGIYQSKTKFGDKAPGWKGGISFIPYCIKFNKLLKEEIRNRDNRICQNCGKTEIENKEKLCVHHIHYDKENCYPDLISLCRVCNIKANSNRDYWEEYFMIKLKEINLLNYFGDMK